LNINSNLLDLNQSFSNNFKQNMSWSQTKINLNKLFEDFSNMKLWKIDSNIQIQTKALIRGLLK
jgi:hypothetical protein